VINLSKLKKFYKYSLELINLLG